jgi:hypothetical protein
MSAVDVAGLRALLEKAFEPKPDCGREHIDHIHVENDWSVRVFRARRDIGELLPTLLTSLEAVTAERDAAVREEVCPVCEGSDKQNGEFCPAGCRDGLVRWTSANVLRNTKFWRDSDHRMRMKAEARALASEQRVAVLEEALKFYANPAIYKAHPHGSGFDDRDVSYVAVRALSQKEPE